jgi:hypothetical protein
MKIKPTLAMACLALAGGAASATDLVIATVNNGHMIEMRSHAPVRESLPDISSSGDSRKALRSRVTRDIATKGGQFDVMTIGMYETRSGQEGLAEGTQTRRQLRRRRPPAGDAQRPVGGRQTLRGAVLWRSSC